MDHLLDVKLLLLGAYEDLHHFKPQKSIRNLVHNLHELIHINNEWKTHERNPSIVFGVDSSFFSASILASGCSRALAVTAFGPQLNE